MSQFNVKYTMTKDFWKQIKQISSLLSQGSWEDWANTYEPYDSIEFDAENAKISAEKETQQQKQALKRTASKATQRLQIFLDTGIWKNRVEIKISDEDSRLQDLLISLNKQWLNIKSRAGGLYTQAELKKNEINDLKVLNNKAVDKIQEELKFRQTRRDKRKFSFLIDN